MIRQYAEFALHSGRSNLVYLLIQKESTGGHHFKSNFVCHGPWRIQSKDN
jgi:hypothetical protein